jgi:hypothetical protein
MALIQYDPNNMPLHVESTSDILRAAGYTVVVADTPSSRLHIGNHEHRQMDRDSLSGAITFKPGQIANDICG